MISCIVAPLATATGCFAPPPIVADEPAAGGSEGGSDSRGEDVVAEGSDDDGDSGGNDDDDDDDGPLPGGDPGELPADAGRIAFYMDEALYLIEIDIVPTLRNISQELSDMGWAPGEDTFINISPDGAFLVIETDRGHPACEGWPCLTVVRRDLFEPSTLIAGPDAMHSEFGAAVAPGGDTVVFSGPDGPHDSDLWVTHRQGDAWTAPELLTPDSNHADHQQPSISADGTRVLFDCVELDTHDICEVGIDGSDMHVVVSHLDDPSGTFGRTHHAVYADDGSIVFEAAWPGEAIWRVRPGEPPSLVGPGYADDHSPCILPGGAIASIWYGREANQGGTAELKIMTEDGLDYGMLLADVDVFDIGLGCGA